MTGEGGTKDTRRGFLRAGLAGAAASALAKGREAAAAAQPAAAPAAAASAAAPAGYVFLRPAEAAFVEAVADHMVPADALSPSGTDIGIPTYIDRALAGAWGQGERLYLQGPFAAGTPNQGYQLPLTPAQLFRAGTESLDAHARAAHGKPFAQLPGELKEQLLQGLQSGRIAWPDGPPAATWFAHLHQLVIEGLYADPIHGGNRGKAGWRIVGFTGVIQTNRRRIVEFRDRPYTAEPLGIADLA